MSYFNKLVSVTGGSAQRLSTLLTANGYTGSMIGTRLSITAPSGASLFTGSSSSVDNTTGTEWLAGDTYSEHASGLYGDVIDPSQIYLYLASTANVNLVFAGLG